LFTIFNYPNFGETYSFIHPEEPILKFVTKIKMLKTKILNLNKAKQTSTINFFLTISLFISFLTISAQTDSSDWKKLPKVSYSGFVDIFYAYDFNDPQSDYRQTFLYNHKPTQ
jgi:hypothetical protein